MFRPRFAFTLAAALLPSTGVFAQDQQYTVWSSLVLTRTGERTPEYLGTDLTALTSLGATQAYAAGSFFRERYLLSAPTTNGVGGAPLYGLSPNLIDISDTYVNALDEQWTVTSAQAFIQGLYPPFTPSTTDATAGSQLAPSSILANGTYVESPLQGYQYAQINTVSGFDPDFIYLSANLDCPAFDAAATAYSNSAQFNSTQNATAGVYETVGQSLLSDVLVADAWGYVNAYAIFDYVNYQNTHNATFASTLAESYYSADGITYLNILKWLADAQQFAQLGDLAAINSVSGQPMPNNVMGSISTIAGNMFASLVLGQLQAAIEAPTEASKLNLLFTDYEPFMSFFALADLPATDSNFYGLPSFGSSAAFELFSYTDGSLNMSMPSTDDLWVRFYFRNGTDDVDNYVSYPLFGNDPSATDMRWSQFQSSMSGIIMADVGDWCTQCGAANLFCAAWNATDGYSSPLGASGSGAGHWGGPVSPAVAGVIGAVVALVVALKIFLLTMLFGRFRVHRVERKSDLGGFKGGKKMRSDEDLVIPKNGVVVSEPVERDSPMSPVGGGVAQAHGHERVGSWELKVAQQQQQQQQEQQQQQQQQAAHTFDDVHESRPVDDDGDHGLFAIPVRPVERV